MDYLRSYSLSADDAVVAAWDSQVASAAEIAPLSRLLAERGAEVFPEFARRYAEIRALPRSARRALQRRLAHSTDIAIPAAWRRRLAYSLAGAALLLALAAAPAEAGDIFVSPKTSANTAVDGKCSLLEAIINANNHDDTAHPECQGATSGANTIHLPSGSQTVPDFFGIYYGSLTGLPAITSDITIVGNKSSIVRKAPSFFRLFAVADGAHLTLDTVTLSGGVASNDGVTKGNADGGGVFVDFFASLTLQNSTITGNVGDRGGAIFAGGHVDIDHSVLSKNTASSGGGVFNRAGPVTITNNSIVTGNKASYRAGGIYTYFAETIINGSTVSKNSAPNGGGIFNSIGNTTIVNGSVITGNKASQDGGGISSSAYTNIDDSTLSKNSAGNRGGGAFSNHYTFVLTNSYISGNKAGTAGGGVYTTGTAFTNTNNTFSKNKAPTGADHVP